jgi:DNA-binding FadR family transcriptional regulator
MIENTSQKTDPAPLGKIAKRTVVESVMEKMKQLIISGHYRPGDKLPTEQEMAKSFGIARGSVREAVKIFNYLGVLESVAGRGTFVRERGNISFELLTWAVILEQKDFAEMLRLRFLLEEEGMRSLYRAYTKDPAAIIPILESLEREYRNMEYAIGRQDEDGRIEADYNFHRTIVQCSNSLLYLTLYRALRNFMFEVIKSKMLPAYIAKPHQSTQHHQDYIDAIKSGKLEKMTEVCKHHRRIVVKVVQPTLEKELES